MKPFIRYILQVILSCYVEFESGRFRCTDAIEACPSAGRSAVLTSLKKLAEEGILRKEGVGRATFYVRNNDSVD